MNAALELLGISSQNRRYAFTYVDSIGVIERHRFVDGAQEAARWAHLVQRNGLEPGACVLVLAGRDRHWRSALLGVVEAGGIAMPCPASTPVAEIRSLAAASGAVGGLSACPRPDVAESAGMTILCADDLESRQTAWAHAEVACPTSPNDFAVIVNELDGSSLRGAAYTHQAILEQASSGAHRLGLREGECVWCTVPEGSAASLWLMLAAWHARVELLVVEDDLPTHVKLELLDRLKPAAVWSCDEEYAALAAADAPAWVDLSSIRHAMTSGEPTERATAFQDAFGELPRRRQSRRRRSSTRGPAPAEPLVEEAELHDPRPIRRADRPYRARVPSPGRACRSRSATASRASCDARREASSPRRREAARQGTPSRGERGQAT